MPWGSSPLARGTFREQFKHHGGGRLTPAHAGNTSFSRLNVQPVEAHPHSRGEHYVPAAAACATAGSSPLARRTQPQPHQQRLRRRLIPTNVGNTDSPGRTVPAGSAHPRSRGEHDAAVIHGTNSPGSSPLTKGTQQSSVHPSVTIRLIPARAGNTRDAHPRTLPWLAHPRSRGEHGVSMTSTVSPNGSSPLARGTLPHYPRVPYRRRLIPARAGNTEAQRQSCRS